MALMIPSTPPSSGGGAHAERLIFEALRLQLSDEYFVYHGLDLLGRNAAEGEIDFLVLHRLAGLLVIECKGEGVEADAEGNWWRRLHDGSREQLKKSPMQQAQNNKYQLVEELEARLPRHLPAQSGRLFPFVHGHAVAFPKHSLTRANLPLELDRNILLDSSDLPQLGRRVQAIMAYWSQKLPHRPQPLTDAEFKRFRKDVLHPKLALVQTLGASLEADRQAFHHLTLAQAEILRRFLVNRRLRVEGAAGTGKTVLALEAARQLASEGAQVLFLCYTKALARFVARHFAAEEGLAGSVSAVNFHAHGAAAYRALGRVMEVPPPGQVEAAKRFWDEEVPLVMLEALETGKLPRFDAVVVDEGQDFGEFWWPVVEGSLREPSGGALVVFYDPKQQIFGRPQCVPVLPTLMPLLENFRNTKEICKVVGDLGGGNLRPHRDAPEGEPPSVYPQESPAKTIAKLEELLRKWVQREGVPPDHITILTPHSRENSTLRGLTELAGLPLASDPSDRAGQLLHTTIGAFKGLESDLVVLLDLDPEDPRCHRNARYVAASRACQRLHVFSNGDWRK